MKYIHSLINGELIKTNESITRENPASLEKIYEVSMCSEKEVDLACNCAQEAFKAWSKSPIISSGCSIPIDNLTYPGVTPAANNSSSVN